MGPGEPLAEAPGREPRERLDEVFETGFREQCPDLGVVARSRRSERGPRGRRRRREAASRGPGRSRRGATRCPAARGGPTGRPRGRRARAGGAPARRGRSRRRRSRDSSRTARRGASRPCARREHRAPPPRPLPTRRAPRPRAHGRRATPTIGGRGSMPMPIRTSSGRTCSEERRNAGSAVTVAAGPGAPDLGEQRARGLVADRDPGGAGGDRAHDAPRRLRGERTETEAVEAVGLARGGGERRGTRVERDASVPGRQEGSRVDAGVVLEEAAASDHHEVAAADGLGDRRADPARTRRRRRAAGASGRGRRRRRRGAWSSAGAARPATSAARIASSPVLPKP